MRVDECEEPHHIALTNDAGTADETQTELWLSEEGAQTRLVVEERGLPKAALRFYAAGWHVHIEDLRQWLASSTPVHPEGWSSEAPAAAWLARWNALGPHYESAPVI